MKQQYEDESDQEAGQQQDGHDDHLLLVDTDLCQQEQRRRVKWRLCG